MLCAPAGVGRASEVWKPSAYDASVGCFPRQSSVIGCSGEIAGAEGRVRIMLPSTGGIGVNVFYAVGALLVIGSLFLAIMRGFKR